MKLINWLICLSVQFPDISGPLSSISSVENQNLSAIIIQVYRLCVFLFQITMQFIKWLFLFNYFIIRFIVHTHDCVLQASSEIENIPERVTNETKTTVSGMEKVVFLLFRNNLHADGCKFHFSKFLRLLLALIFRCMISVIIWLKFIVSHRFKIRYCKMRKYGKIQIFAPMAQQPLRAKINRALNIFQMY